MGDLADQLFGHDIAILRDIPDPVHRALALCHGKEICRQETRTKPMLVPQPSQRKTRERRRGPRPIGWFTRLKVEQALQNTVESNLVSLGQNKEVEPETSTDPARIRAH